MVDFGLSLAFLLIQAHFMLVFICFFEVSKNFLLSAKASIFKG